MGSIPGSGRPPQVGNGRGAWWSAVHVTTKSHTWLSYAHTHTLTILKNIELLYTLIV